MPKKLPAEEGLRRKRESKRQWQDRWRKAHPEEHRRRKDEWYEKNRAQILARRRDLRYKKLFGISEDEYQELLGFQNGVCAICGKPPGAARLHVDHDHETREVRGLLCYRCNHAIGLLDDSPETAIKLAAYLQSFPAKQVLNREP